MQSNELTVMDTIGILTGTFTAATTDIVTSNSHGLKENDKVVLTTTGTLPAGLSLATTYYAKKITTNTFKLSESPQENVSNFVDVTDTGTGTHTWTMRADGSALDTEAADTVVLEFISDNSADLTVKLQGSTQTTEPTWTSAQSTTNRYEYKAMQGQQDPYIIKKGDVGLVVSSDTSVQYLADVRGLNWLNAIISTYSAGDITIKATLTK